LHPSGHDATAVGCHDLEVLSEFDYYLDESDPDVVLLRRRDGSLAAAFSAQGATREGTLQATKEDHAGLLASRQAPSIEARSAA
jgi:hypothetical protein